MAARPGDFRVIGPRGGGAQYNPTVSPHDPNTILISCDMTGAYITHDGGKSWRMFDLRGVVKFFVFDPNDPDVVYADATALWRSADKGETWTLLYPKAEHVRAIQMASDHAEETIVAEPDPMGAITAFAVSPHDSHFVCRRCSVWHGTVNGRRQPLDILSPVLDPGNLP